MKLGSIKTPDFIDFLALLKPKKSAKTFVFVDNLRAHHAKDTKAYCKEANIQLVFNAAYSSELNPIERLWLFSKRIFYKRLIEFSDWKDEDRMYALVEECVRAVPTYPIESHVKTCLERMRSDLKALN